MKIKTARLENFMLFDDFDMAWSPNINVICGSNSTGKTVLIKFMYALLKAWRDMLFSFRDDVAAIKYDDTTFYRKSYNAIEGSKGVDIIADSDSALYLEGDFSCKSRSNGAIYRELQGRIRKRLKWLNCRVSVVSIKTDRPRDYEVSQERRG